MDDLEAGAQPHCPNDGIIMRDVPGGWCCPDCGYVEMIPRDDAGTSMPPEFDGPSIHGG